MGEKPYELEKWIAVSFELELSKNVSVEDVNKIAMDCCLIVLNTGVMFNSRVEPLGNYNPLYSGRFGSHIFRYRFKNRKIETDSIINVKATKELTCYNVSKEFTFQIINKEDKVKIEILPVRTKEGKNEYDLYCLKALDIEMGCLSGAQNLICEKYGIELEEDPCYPYYNGPLMIDNEPWLEMHAGILLLKGSYKNVKLYSDECPKLFDHVFTNARDIIQKYSIK